MDLLAEKRLGAILNIMAMIWNTERLQYISHYRKLSV